MRMEMKLKKAIPSNPTSPKPSAGLIIFALNGFTSL